MTVVVLGSLNVDLVVSAPRLPRAGETVRGTSLETYPGGKGANQAVAAARMGADVELFGRVGDDPHGRFVTDALVAAKVGTSGVSIDRSAATGVALITVAEDGTNTIVTTGGANRHVGADELAALERRIASAKALLVQLEVPVGIVVRACALARDASVTVVLDPAPIADVPDELFELVDWITPNEGEAEALTGFSGHDAAHELNQRGVRHAVVTMGGEGCVYVGEAGSLMVPAPRVDAIDTVACGDAFNGALAAAAVKGEPVERALREACAAGAATATRKGAYPALPRREDVVRLTGPI